MTEACRTTQHCAHFGWCHRCDPQFSEAMQGINGLIQENADPRYWGVLYEQIGRYLRSGGGTGSFEITYSGDPVRGADSPH